METEKPTGQAPEIPVEAATVVASPAVPPRKYVGDADGNYSPAPSVDYGAAAPPHAGLTPPFAIGDYVGIQGQVEEVQHSQGGQWNVRVRLENDDMWVVDSQLKHLANPKEDKAVKGPTETK